jgi:pyruvate/2-oxoglutarate dehydrogenase complex dihydrolipoamide acyltransferase (E2) component
MRTESDDEQRPEDAELLRWLVPDGSRVNAGDCVCEVETTKAVQEVQAPESGVLRQLKKVGERVSIGNPPFRIEA